MLSHAQTPCRPSHVTSTRIAGIGAALLLSGCASKIDKLTVNRVVARALTVPDVDQSCEIGVSLRSPLAAATKEEKPARKALLISEATAAMCDEVAAWSHELDRARALSSATGLPPQLRAIQAKDAGYAADRSHQRAAARYDRAWKHGLVSFGDIGEGDCPKLKSHDEFAYFITLVSGTQSVLHDSNSGRTLDIPQERLLKVVRGAECLRGDPDDDGTVDGKKWFYFPEAVQAAAWATIPGSGPEGVDPWDVLEEVGAKGEGTGVRVARGLQVTIAANAGREDIVAEAIVRHAAALDAHEQSASHALLDRYAFLLSLHQSDLMWIAEEGYRTPAFGELPGAASAPAEGDDPFGGDGGGDPFGGGGDDDPFGGDPGAEPTDVPPSDPFPAGDGPDSPAQEP